MHVQILEEVEPSDRFHVAFPASAFYPSLSQFPGKGVISKIFAKF
jgi:hypothetical protein